jgi:hypothetical protein
MLVICLASLALCLLLVLAVQRRPVMQVYHPGFIHYMCGAFMLAVLALPMPAFRCVVCRPSTGIRKNIRWR